MGINIVMKLYEITCPLNTYIARIRLKDGAIVTATERTESLAFARQIFHHKFGQNNVYSVSEWNEQVGAVEEAIQTLTAPQLQVKALSQQQLKLKQQKRQLQAAQAMAKAQAKVRDANKAVGSA